MQYLSSLARSPVDVSAVKLSDDRALELVHTDVLSINVPLYGSI